METSGTTQRVIVSTLISSLFVVCLFSQGRAGTSGRRSESELRQQNNARKDKLTQLLDSVTFHV